MKKLALMCFAVAAVSFAANAQTVKEDVKNGAHTVAKDTKKGAKAVGNKTAEVASKGKSKVMDQTYKDKAGPDGQTIYIDKHSKYYWVDKKGHKEYVSKASLRDK